MNQLQPLVSRPIHDAYESYVLDSLKNCSHVFVKDKQVKLRFSPPYKGPYKVLKKNRHSFTLQSNRGSFKAHLSNLKPTYSLISEDVCFIEFNRVNRKRVRFDI